MVTRYGMSDALGTVLYGSEHSDDEVFLGRDFSSGKGYSEETAAKIDSEIRRIIAESYDRCKTYLTEHVDKLHFVAEFLLKYESMDEEQFKAAMESDCPTLEQIAQIAKDRARLSEEENKTETEKKPTTTTKTAHENNQRAIEEEERKKREEEERRRSASPDDLLDNFFRDMQNGTLTEVNIPDAANGPLDLDNDNNSTEDNNTDGGGENK